MKLPKISLGTSNKRAYFDKSHNYNGTTEFGFCLPTLFDEIEANTKIRLNTNTFVRLGVLPQPSFAPIKLKQYNNFVPIHDVFEAYDYFIAQQTVQSAIASYVPSEVDNVKAFSHLLAGIMLSSPCALYSNTYAPLFHPCAWMVKKSASENVATIITSDASDAGTLAVYYFLSGFAGGDGMPSSGIFGADPIVAWTNATYIGAMLNGIGTGSFTPAYSETNYPQLKKWLYMTPTFDNADFTFRIQENYATDTDLYITIHLTHEGKRLFKVLQCIGYQFGYDSNVSVLPIYAYYKTWFDLFQPHREVQWKQTLCYKLIHGYYDTGESLDGCFNAGQYTTHFNMFDAFFGLLHEIPYCCYTLAVDPVTVATTNPSQGNSISRSDLFYVSDSDTEAITVAPDMLPNGTNSNESILVRAMLKILPMINKNSVIGARVEKYMQLHYGVSLPQNFNFGKDEMNINISDVFSTSDTFDASSGTGSALGEYAGKGIGYGNGNTHTFESNRKGFIFQISCIVPVGSYSQSMNPLLRNITLNEQYLSEYDGLGMAPMHKSEVFGTRSVFFNRAGSSETFGFRPRLFEYKIKYNVRAGGFANRSERFQFMPYQLDRVFTEADYSVQPYLNDTSKLMITEPVTVLCDDSLRYIGNDEDYGNYDRIFEDQLGVTDNFIIHIVHDYGITSPMLPISQSFDTFDNEGLSDDNGKIDVTHA